MNRKRGGLTGTCLQADGQVLKVYPKIGGLPSSSSNRAAKDIGKDQIIDGSLGFPDPNQKHQLYSDRLVGGGNSNRRGRGGQRGRGSR